ncbi:MAG: DNA translocase FtsK 4TM domain-containing protein [Thiotrichales bacterium]|nr:DNA translocase FtsK 4TM domain-containing protein [Thiotrichales bacterium]
MSFKPVKPKVDTNQAPRPQKDVKNHVSWVFKDAVVLSCIGLAFFLFIVLFSYEATDPGFDSAGGVHEIKNYGGKTGAWLSSMVLYVFGIFGFLIPFGILLAGWVTLKIRSGSETDYLRFGVSLLGLILLISAGSGLANLYMQPHGGLVNLPYSSGGVWGYEFSTWLVGGIDLLGATLFLLVLFAVAFSMLSSCTWLSIIESTGRVAWSIAEKVKTRAQNSDRLTNLARKAESSFAGQSASSSNASEEKSAGLVIAKKHSVSRQESQPQISKRHPLLAPISKVFLALKNRTLTAPTSKTPDQPNPTAYKVEPSISFDVPDYELQPTEPDGKPAKVTTSQQSATVQSSQVVDTEQSTSARKTEQTQSAHVDTEPPSVATQTPSENSTVTSPAGTLSHVKVGTRKAPTSTFPIIEHGDLPSLELLDPIPDYEEGFSEEELKSLSALLEQRLLEFGITVKVESVQPGPVVTRFEILPAPGVKVSQINNLAKDLARVLSLQSVRVVDVIPGKAFVGIEIPNEQRELVSFREVLASDEFQRSVSPLTIALGKDIAGKPVVADIAKMPHLLVAGTTGSGKSVGVNSMILSLLYKSRPDEVRLIMVDPKMLELSIYEDIPHLLTPVVTDMSDAANALRWCVFEMDRRYQLMAKLGVRNIAGYNAKVKAAIAEGKPLVDPLYQQAASFGHDIGESPPTLDSLPFIVVVVDEFADMIMVVGKEVEQLIARIAQKARAAGIHLVLATQRPSVNVITGLIKANIPTRISFMVNTKIDSRTILDQGGAEQLLGMGDMLFMPPGSGTPRRVHGAFMNDDEVHKVVEFIKTQGQPQYLDAITKGPGSGSDSDGFEDAEQDLLYDEAVEFVVQGRKVSISSIQRRFKIGYNRAARIVETMEAAGVVSTSGSNGNREVLAPKPQD